MSAKQSGSVSGFHRALGAEAARTSGPIVLVELDTEDLLAAAHASRDDVAVYFVHRSAEVLRRAFLSMARMSGKRPVAYFHGRAADFLREIPVHPALLAAQDPEHAFVFWQDLPADAVLVAAEGLSEAAHWAAQGFLEQAGGGFDCGVYRTKARFGASSVCIPPGLFRDTCASLQAALFGTSGQMNAGEYTPQNRATEPVRRWWRKNERAGMSGYGEWPYSAAPTPLPETLPNGERWPMISVVTPSFNQGKYIEETILSVAGQGYPRVEHIVMDGGSTDETLAVIERHRHQLTAAESEKDRGQSHAINKGMARATGDILTWLNSDDMLAPGALAAAGMAFYTSRADLVAGVVLLRSKGKTIGRHLTCCEPGPLPLEDLLDLDGGWNAGKFFYQPEVMFSRGIWERAGGMVREDLHYSMDYDLWVRMAETGGQIHVIGHPLAWFRVHEEQKTSVEENFKAELRRYVDEYRARRKMAPPPSKAQERPLRKPRITMLNDHGFQYGAGIAHRRMAEMLQAAGHSVAALSLRADPGHYGEATALTAEDVATAVRQSCPDIVIAGNLHSAGTDPWQLGLVAEEFPTLAVLHDFWLLTGRCSYPGPCNKYLTGCDSTCPTWQEYPRLEPDKIAGAWERKQKLLFSENRLALLGNSEWACSWARSAMETTGGGRKGRPVERFRLSFPLDIFRPKDRQTCRAVLGLPPDRFIVLLSGDLHDPRKNMQLSLDALESLRLENLTIVSLGERLPGERLPFEDIRRLGRIDDPETMASLCSAADLYLAPSREETFGQVFIESIACGTPVIGVRASGMQEAVVEGLTGLLIDECTAEALAAAIFELYRKPELRRQMGQWGRLYVQNEWSVEASYYHMFHAWRRLGLLERLRVPEKIDFVLDRPPLPECQSIHRLEGLTMHPVSFGPEEGPYPELSLPRFRWAFGPMSEMKAHSSTGGAHSLVLRYRNVLPGQTMKLTLNGSSLGTFSLPDTGLANGRLVCLKTELQAGQNALTMEFSRWTDPGEAGRPMAAAFTEIRFLPDAPDMQE